MFTPNTASSYTDGAVPALANPTIDSKIVIFNKKIVPSWKLFHDVEWTDDRADGRGVGGGRRGCGTGPTPGWQTDHHLRRYVSFKSTGQTQTDVHCPHPPTPSCFMRSHATHSKAIRRCYVGTATQLDGPTQHRSVGTLRGCRGHGVNRTGRGEKKGGKKRKKKRCPSATQGPSSNPREGQRDLGQSDLARHAAVLHHRRSPDPMLHTNNDQTDSHRCAVQPLETARFLAVCIPEHDHTIIHHAPRSTLLDSHPT